MYLPPLIFTQMVTMKGPSGRVFLYKTYLYTADIKQKPCQGKTEKVPRKNLMQIWQISLNRLWHKQILFIFLMGIYGFSMYIIINYLIDTITALTVIFYYYESYSEILVLLLRTNKTGRFMNIVTYVYCVYYSVSVQRRCMYHSQNILYER